MSTRFYLPSSGTSPLNSLALDANWEGSVSTFFRAPAPTHKTNTSLTNFAARFLSTSSQNNCWGQWVSEPLLVAHEFSTDETYSIIVRGLEDNAACDAHISHAIRVVSGDGATVRGTLASAWLSGTELVTSAATRVDTGTVAEVQAEVGDRIVIEFGAYGISPSVDYDVTWRFGDPVATYDFSYVAALTSDLCPWVSLSPNLIFGTNSTTLYAVSYPTSCAQSAVAPYDDESWNNITQIGIEDSNDASIVATTFDTNDYSQLVTAQHFDFAIPSDATITGLEIVTDARTAAGTANWAMMRLLNASGTAEGDNNASDGGAFVASTKRTWHRFGGPTDLWGMSLTPSMVNDDDFGVQLAVQATADDTDILNNMIQMIVYYSTAQSATAVLVTHSPTIYQAVGEAASETQEATAVLVPHAAAVQEATGTPGATSAVAVLTTHAASIPQATGVPADTGATAQFRSHSASVHQATGVPSAAGSEALLVEHAPSVSTASGAPGIASAISVLVESTPTVQEATGVSGGAAAVAVLVESSPLVQEATGAPGATSAIALLVESAATVFAAFGTEEKLAVALLVEHEAVVAEASGVAGATSGEALLVESSASVFAASGVGAALEAEALFVGRTASTYGARGMPATQSATAVLVERAPAIMNATGAVGGAAAIAPLVQRFSSTYNASGQSATISASALLVAHASSVYTAGAGLIELVPLHGGEVLRVNWRATIKAAGWDATVEPSAWSATAKEDR